MSGAEKILLEALALPRELRGAIVAELIESLEPADSVDAGWQAEARRRVAAIRSGESTGAAADEVHARLRGALGRGG